MQTLFGSERLAFDGGGPAVTALPIEATVARKLLQELSATKDYSPGDCPPSSRAMPFMGHAIVPVKANGSVALPAFARRVLVARGSRIFLGLHETDFCLVGFSQSWHERVTGELGRRHLERLDGDAASGGYARRVFGFCEEIWRPSDGMRLSESARAIAGIKDTALFVGAGETFEIWSPDEAAASGEANLVALARSAAKFRT